MSLRHFLADDDLTAAEQRAVLDRALALKAAPFADRCLEGPRTVAILFDKPTLRTQVSFVGAVSGLGGLPMVVDGRLAGVATAVAALARDAGFIVNPVTPDALRLAPPLVVATAELDLFVDALPGLLDAAVATTSTAKDAP